MSHQLADQVQRIRAVFLALVMAGTLAAQVSVTTGQYNNSRTGANMQEIILNQTNVNVTGFGKLFTWVVDGWVFTQPLYVPGVQIGTGTYNVVYIATMNNSVYAFDADHLSNTPLWKVTYAPAMPASTLAGTCPTYGTGAMGILGTPVIDPATDTMYFVDATPGTPSQGGGYVFYINAVDIRTGAHKFASPLLVQGSVAGTGYDSVNGVVSFHSSTQNSRPALTLSGGYVYAGFASCGPDIPPFHGWVFSWKAAWLAAHNAPWNATANGEQGGVWQSGHGFVADASGNIYLETGDGSVGNQMFGDSIVKLNAWGGALSWYTPGSWVNLTTYDLDLSSSGPVEIPGSGMIFGSGKQGIVYLTNEAHLQPTVQSFQASTPCLASNARDCSGIYGMAYWGTSTTGTMYEWASKDNLRAFSFANGKFATTPASQNNLLSDSTGGTVSISSNGLQSGSGIAWATVGSGYPYYTPQILPTVYAYDATNVSRELWDSSQNAARDGISGTAVSKWIAPTVVNGRVYVPTFDSYVGAYNVYVYGLLTPGGN